MAHLLGSQTCMDSLSRDVENIQETMKAVLLQAGPTKFASWKFPTKLASDIDVAELLDDYAYSDDEDSNQLAHIILFEFVIDRLAFLLQGVTQLCEGILSNGDALTSARSQSRAFGATMSVGLIVASFWNKFLQVVTGYKQLKAEVIEKRRLSVNCAVEVGTESEHANELLERSTRSFGSGEQRKHVKQNDSHSPPQDPNDNVKDVLVLDRSLKQASDSCKATQTYETSFVPCDACAAMQKNLLEVGASVITVCESQGLPSALAKQKKLLQKSLITAADVSRWASEQSKDLQRIRAHLDYVSAQVEPLRSSLKEAQDLCSAYRGDIKGLENDKRDLMSKFDLQKTDCDVRIVAATQDLRKEIDRKAQDVDVLQKRVMEFEERCEKITKEREKTQASYGLLEKDHAALSAQRLLESKELDRLHDVESQLTEAVANSNKLGQRISELESDVKKLQGENRALLKHDQTLQGKQAQLLKRFDVVHQECEELRESLARAEEEMETLVQKVNAHVREKLELESKLADTETKLRVALQRTEKLVGHTDDLELKGEIERLKEKLKLLVCYPVFGEKLDEQRRKLEEIMKDSQFKSESSNDVLRSMQDQLRADHVRIALLQEQSLSLQSAVNKLTAMQANPVAVDLKRQLESLVEQNQRVEDSSSSHGDGRLAPGMNRSSGTYPIEPRPPNQPRSSTKQGRPWSGGKADQKDFDFSARLAKLERMRGDLLGDGGRFVKDHHQYASSPRLACDSESASIEKTPFPQDGQRHSENSLQCPGCGKTYLSQRDLDIHRPFCCGRL